MVKQNANPTNSQMEDITDNTEKEGTMKEVKEVVIDNSSKSEEQILEENIHNSFLDLFGLISEENTLNAPTPVYNPLNWGSLSEEGKKKLKDIGYSEEQINNMSE